VANASQIYNDKSRRDSFRAIKNKKRREDSIGRNRTQYTENNGVTIALDSLRKSGTLSAMKKTPTEWTVRIAAAASATLEELIMELPSSCDIARDARKLADKIDRRFDLVQLSIPVGN
jgi:hypothetical protein